MALVTQNIAATGSYVPYERPPQPYTLWTAIPRGLQSFVVDGQQVDVKPVNDEFLLNVTATLPPNFGYVMQDLNFTVAQNRAEDWSAVVNLNLQNFYRAPETEALALAGNWVNDWPIFAAGIAGGQTRSLSGPLFLPTMPIVGVRGTTGILIVAAATNQVATVTLTGILNMYMAFWQFDLEQIRKFPINTPLPTHPR